MIRAALLATAVLLLAPAAASALPDTVVDFERVPAGATIDNQYVSPEGVDFGSPQEFGLPAFGYTCTPVAQDGGISGRSANLACQAKGNGDATNLNIFNVAFEFQETRRRVSFNLRNTDPTGSRLDESADVRFYAPGGVLLNQQTISFPSATDAVPVLYQQDAPQIAAVTIRTNSTPDRLVGDLPPVFLDDIAAAKDETPPDPEFALALQKPSVSVYEGSTATASVSVRRFNGSTGAVNLSVPGGLPPGIAGVQFDPNPVSGRNPSAMRISAGSPFTGSRQLTVRATGASPDAGTAANGDLTQTVVGLPAVTIGGGGTATLIRGCGPQSVVDAFTVRGGYAGKVVVGTTGPPTGPAILTVPKPVVDVNGDGDYPFSFDLTPGLASGGGTYTVTTTPDHGTPDTAERSYTIADVQVDSAASPAGVAINRPFTPGPLAVVTGDFPAQCEVKFVDQHGTEYPIFDRHRVEINGRARDQITLQVPLLATSGPLSVVSVRSGLEVAKTPPLDIIDFRNVFGSSAANSGSEAGTPNWSWEEFAATFAGSKVEKCHRGVCARDPLAQQYYTKYQTKLQAFGGLCEGFSIMAMRFAGFGGAKQLPSDYQAGAKRAWDITNVADGTAWKRDLIRWHVRQYDPGAKAAVKASRNLSAADERTLLRRLLTTQGSAFITIYFNNGIGTSAHGVVAYAEQENQPPQGGEVAPVTVVRIYDPDLPYDRMEESDTTTQAVNQTGSTIRIDGDGNWYGTGFAWSGPNAKLAVEDGLPPADARLPKATTYEVEDTDAATSPRVKLAGIAADGKPALNADGEPLAGAPLTSDPEVTGGTPDPQYELQSGHSYAATVRGLKAGRYTQGQYAGGVVGTVSATTAPGQEDTLAVTPGKPAIGFKTSAAKTGVEYDVAEQVGTATRAVKVDTTAGKGGDRVDLTGGALRLDHTGGATTAAVSLTSVGEGAPATVTTVPLRVAAGQRLEVRPRSWSDLGAGARYVVRDKRGRVVRRGKARLRAPSAVSVTGVRAKLRKGVVTVTGRVGKRGSAPLLAALATFKRGGKVVKRQGATLQGAKVKAGAFSLAIKVGKVPARARGQVTITLSDQDAIGAASARRVVKLRR